MNHQWTERQKKIFEGLSSIGQEIAGFYEAALEFYYVNFPNGAYFLLHAAREIDGGLRDILGVNSCTEEKNHTQSIRSSLGSQNFEGLAEDWHKAANKLQKYAHRHGAWKLPRQIQEVKPVWDQFENVLERLVGSYYGIIERIERISKIENFEKEGVVDALCNLLAIPSHYNYFFRKEKDVKWFTHLKNKQFFSAEKIPFDKNGNAQFWNVLDYLERVSEQTKKNQEYGKDLIEILQNIVKFSEKEKKINNSHIWWYCVKILNNIPVKIITENLSVKEFHKWLIVWLENSIGMNLLVSEIGEKLLPRFLENNSTLSFSETIINTITEIKKRKKSSEFLTETRTVIMKWDPFWVLDIFKKNAKAIGEKCSIDVIFLLAKRLNQSLEYVREKSHIEISSNSSVYKTEVSRVPKQDLKKGEIGYQNGKYILVLSKCVPKQVQGIETKETELTKFDFIAHNKEAFVSEIKQHLSKDADLKKLKVFDEKLGSIFDKLFSDNSNIWFQFLAEGREHTIREAEEVITIILRDVLLAKCEKNPKEGKKVLEEFLFGKYHFPIFKRFVLFCIGKYWKEYKEFFSKFLELLPDTFEKYAFEADLFDILKHHNSDFDDALKTKLQNLINNSPKKDKQSAAYWKYKWLSPLRENPYFADLYEEAKNKVKPKGDNPYEPNRKVFTTFFYEGYLSPLSKEGILQMSVSEFIKYTIEFKAQESFFEEKPSKEGLAEAFQAAVKEQSKHFTDEINLLIELDYFYLSYFVRGLQEAWVEDQKIDWKNIFDFFLQYFGKGKDFIINEAIKSQRDIHKGKYIRIIDSVMDLIEEGCKNDNRAFPSKYFDKVQKIFELVEPLLKGKKHLSKQEDALTYVLNSTFGKTIMSFILFSLRKTRVTNKIETDWGQNRYERFFSIGIDAHIWFGCYLPQIKYLDNKYAEEKINEFNKKDVDNIEWKAFMEGYLSGAQIYKDVYLLMRLNYKKALQSNIVKDRAEERLVQHIAIGYLQGYELLQEKNTDKEDSLFWVMLMDKKTENKHTRWLEIPDFFWAFTEKSFKKDETVKREPTSEERKKKILEFWAWTYKNRTLIETKLGKNYESFLSKLSKLTVFIDSIDEDNKKWLLLSAPYIGLHHNEGFFIEYLTKFEDVESIKRIGQIFQKILDGITPTYQQENIKLLVRRIYEKGQKEDADIICNTYGRRGSHFLRDIWKEYQQKNDQKRKFSE
jgi:hypothetical protein